MKEEAYYVPAPMVSELTAAKDAAFQLALQNERLQVRLQEKQLREEVFSRARENGGRVYTETESGRPVELMDRAAAEVWRMVHCGPEPQPERYCVVLEDGSSIWFAREEYLDDKQLLHTLQTAGIRIRHCRSARQTAMLVRQHFSARMRECEFRYYAGWRLEGETALFAAFDPFSTHQGAAPYVLPRRLEEGTAAGTALAVRGFLAVMDTFRRRELGQFLCLWYHGCAIHTLLAELGEELSFGLVLYSRSERVCRRLTQLFCWYGDKPVDLDMAPFAFGPALLRRKDQPAVILDRGLTGNTGTNAAALGEILATGKVRWRDRKREERLLPLQAPVTVICRTVSGAACLPGLLTLDAAEEDVAEAPWEAEVLEDYRKAFLRYTEQNWQTLRQLLREEPEPGGEAVRTLLALAAFLRGFYRTAGAECGGLLPEDGLARTLTELLDRVGEPGGDTARQFCAIARRCLEERLFFCCDGDREATETERPVVYCTDGSYCFTRRAFRLVCDRLAVRTPAAKALAEAGLLEGKRTNATTLQTRLGVYNEHGILRYVGVYRIGQEEIDTAK